MNVKRLIPCAALLAISLASCSNDETTGTAPIIDEGTPTSFSLYISQPASTRASDGNALPVENDFYKADVFIYDGESLVKHQTLDANTDFTPAGDHKYRSTTEIRTTTGMKEVFVALNMPSDMVSAIKASSTKAGLKAVHEVTAAKLANMSTGFVMFSHNGKSKNFVEITPSTPADANLIEAEVERLVAKVTVQKGSKLNSKVAGGTISKLEYGIMNSNKKIYALQYDDGGIIKDPNWADGSWNANDFEHVTSTEYVDVNENSDVLSALNTKYAPENTSEMHYTKETTYASVRATFIPDEIYDETGQVKIANNNTAGDFWVVIKADGTPMYFNNLAEAQTYKDDFDALSISDKYENGYCYYNMFLNPNGDYNTLRNTYYKTTIGEIYGLGNSSPEEGGNTTIPVQKPTVIDVIIDIIPWTVEEYEYDL